MKMLILQYFEGFFTVRKEICELEIARKAVSYPNGSDEVKPEQGQVRKVVLRQRLLIEVGVYQPEPPERFSPQRITLQVGDKYPPRITDNYMGDCA